MPPTLDQKLGIARNVKSTLLPINGLRHPEVSGTCGWYIWAGEELKQEDDFFVPLHIEHLASWCPTIEHLLALPPGWRFLVAGEQEDVWFDPSLLNV
jgi:hypothetical protein